MKIENWNNFKIRFVEKDGEWWAVLGDVSKALKLIAREVKRRLPDDVVSNHPIKDNLGRLQDTLIVNEFGIYQTIFQSRKKEAKEFQKWTYGVLKQLRQSTGLEGFQIFRMLDKNHQKEAMSKLCHCLKEPVRTDFMKANTIANKAVSNKYGHPKMVKKGDMSPDMLVDRQELLDSTVELMGIKEKFKLNLSVSEEVYKLVEGEEPQKTA